MRSNGTGNPPPHYRQALDLYLAGRLRDTMNACLARLQFAAEPDAPTVALLAHVLLDSGHVVDAAREFARAASLDARNADAWLGLAQCQLAMSDRASALQSIDKALSLSPMNAEVHALSAGLALRAGDGAGAVVLAQRATALAPGLASGWFNLALALQDQARGDDAVHAARKALALAPDDLRAAGLAAVLVAAGGDLAAARATLDRALAKHPNSVALWTVKAWVAGRARDLASEIDAHAHVLAIEPGNAAALSQLVFAKKSALDWDGLAELQQRFRGGVAAKAAHLTPFSFLSDPSTRGEQRLCAATWSEGFAVRDGVPPPVVASAHDGRRLRIGYLSGDFYQHPTAVLLAGVLEAHDRARVEVFAYSAGPDDGSAMRARIVAGVEHFVDIDPRRDAESAARIRADALDVLIDLKGHTEGAATAVLARRPAPVQAHWIGYPGTLAAPFVNYLFTDRVVVPDEHASSYAEALVRLPHSYQPNDRSRVASPAPARADLGLASDAVVLASLVAPWKLNAAVFDAWARILAAAPDTLLWLLARDDADPAIERARRAFAARGVLPERVVFATRRRPDDYLALYSHVDIALDTWPYGAHTTAADALWMGSPLVTWPGESFASRVAASVVIAAGVPELVAVDVEGYVALATDLACNASRRAALRDRLLRARTTSPLYDAAAMARAIESACATMAAQAAAGVRRGFDVGA
jgi:predicted O-linked N-acetylglucosamine transferase (SPINDLY family)